MFAQQFSPQFCYFIPPPKTLYTSEYSRDYFCRFVTLTMLDIENGDTLHLVERQPTQPQTSSAAGSADLSGNGGAQGINC